jgi:pimeloyl-ACP methyl ester carboxylesterase
MPGPVNFRAVALPIHIFFFRGLSTYGHDHAKWSVFDFGPVYKHLARAFDRRGVVFHPVTGMGAGSLEEVTERACAFIEAHPVWRDPAVPVHFFGHSAGGLIARLAVLRLHRRLATEGRRLADKVPGCLTVATPNRGSRLARICMDIPRRHKGSAMVLRSFGYDIDGRRPFFEQLTEENVARAFAAEGLDAAATGVRHGSIVCAAPRTDWCLPLKMFYLVRAFNDFDSPSDGVIERDSQPFGEVAAEIRLDHFRQVGLFGDPAGFNRLCDAVRDHCLTAQGD